MLRHCVMFRWKPDVDGDHIDKVAAGLDELAGLDVVRAYRHGRDAGLSEGNYDYAVVADFDNAADWQVYRDDAGHREFIADMLGPHITERAAVQFEFPG